jgi:hypothetical protein
MNRERMTNPKCLGRAIPDTSSARSADSTGRKMRRITRGVSFDHLVGAGEQRWRHVKAQKPRRWQIDDQVELGCLHHR